MDRLLLSVNKSPDNFLTTSSSKILDSQARSSVKFPRFYVSPGIWRCVVFGIHAHRVLFESWIYWLLTYNSLFEISECQKSFTLLTKKLEGFPPFSWAATSFGSSLQGFHNAIGVLGFVTPTSRHFEFQSQKTLSQLNVPFPIFFKHKPQAAFIEWSNTFFYLLLRFSQRLHVFSRMDLNRWTNFVVLPGRNFEIAWKPILGCPPTPL